MVISVIGKADEHDLVFELTASGKWEAIVPADLDDGKYFLELWVTDNADNTAYYTAILYMFDGRITKLVIAEEAYRFISLGDKYSLRLKPPAYQLALKEW